MRVAVWVLVGAGCASSGERDRPPPATEPATCGDATCTDRLTVSGTLYLGPLALPPIVTFRSCVEGDCVYVKYDTLNDAVAGSQEKLVDLRRPGADGVAAFTVSFDVPAGTLRDGEKRSVDVFAGEVALVASTTLSVSYGALFPNGRACDEPRGIGCRRATRERIVGCGAPGNCTPGDVQYEDSCAIEGHRRSRSCNGACGWSAWSVCGEVRVGVAPPDPIPASALSFRRWANARVVIGAVADGSAQIHAYDPATAKWEAFPAFTAKSCHADAAVLDDRLYVSCDDIPREIDLRTGAVTSLVPPPKPMTSIAAVELVATREVLFLSLGTLATQIYSPATKSWRVAASRASSPCAFLRPTAAGAACLVTEPLGIQSYDVASDRWTTAFAPHTHWAYAGVLPRPSILYVAADGLFYADTYDATTLTWNGSPPISPLVLSAGGEASPEIHTVHGRPFVVQSFPAPSRGVVRDTDGSFRPLPFGLPRVDADTVVVAMDDETLIWNAESKPRVLSIE